MDIKDVVFQQYLDQGKAPWLFGTFVSDFVGDFGSFGALVVISGFSIICASTCSSRIPGKAFSLARLFLILLLYLVPFWGIFYFRFSISNSYIVVNLLFIFFVASLQRLVSTPSNRHDLEVK